jgi:hypothetical protein
VVAVANRERVRERVVERELGTGEVAHRDGAVGVAVGVQVGCHERVHRTVVPAGVLAAPAVVDVVGVVAVLGRRVVFEVERLGEAGRGDPGAGLVAELVEDRAALGVGQDARVGEPADARESAEVVVEGTIFLHEDHNVLDVAETGA